ncbi:hypothetical protein E0L93_12940 [Rubrobacter taiwanensis]|uniref:Uncharacterized protein n=1 Tax=Rubrobacter taiwanensis TaxID=185139 RepID=A0A4R1BDZ8_9ACTN|nr:hypothetical protein [Rubrobacter taiwanensis]TCJ15293.1 hypothetical protein E0L93_12940 [Rubrobacter taiwanensis]
MKTRIRNDAGRAAALAVVLALLFCHGALGSVHEFMHGPVPVAHTSHEHTNHMDGPAADHAAGWTVGYFAVLLAAVAVVAGLFRCFRHLPVRIIRNLSGPGPLRAACYHLPRGPALPRLQVFLL